MFETGNKLGKYWTSLRRQMKKESIYSFQLEELLEAISTISSDLGRTTAGHAKCCVGW